jgi:hypothetical protein
LGQSFQVSVFREEFSGWGFLGLGFWVRVFRLVFCLGFKARVFMFGFSFGILRKGFLAGDLGLLLGQGFQFWV